MGFESASELRDAAFSSCSRRMKVVDIPVNGVPHKWGILEPSIADRTRFAEILGKEATPKSSEAAGVAAVCALVCSPLDREKVWDNSSEKEMAILKKKLREEGFGWLMCLISETMQWLNESQSKSALEEVEKNSKATPADY
jgi:hypothetical protein